MTRLPFRKSTRGHGRHLFASTAVVATTLLTGCGPHADSADDGPAPGTRDQFVPAAVEFTNPIDTEWSVPPPPRLTGELERADMLVIGASPLPARLRNRIDSMPQVRATIPLAMASVRVADRSITVAAVDSASYRRFTPEATATTDGVWDAVAAGEVVLSHQIADDLSQPLGGTLTVRQRGDGLPLRVGAYATTLPRVHAIVNERRGDQLGISQHNALVVALRHDDIAEGTRDVRKVVRDRARVDPLHPTTATRGSHTALLTGGAVADAVGSFSYRYFPDGTVAPQREWVNANIRTESVPILGTVTCHRVMLPQLRAALSEVERRGLTAAIDPDDYGGCYFPRFIGYDPDRGLSLHTWGIAIDLNVAGNHRGTKGEIDRDVVAIFKKWGFAWGGDWDWTDPMHFELAALVRH
ncbi:M15 family metallopeptidase [Haloechinothrix salitolerans]|uniref:M15 family metallopeptidase n=1 Tax=Haloechinothrix salitolerans TaxID=926830 RepID=A0ABW2BTH4_9PSEU